MIFFKRIKTILYLLDSFDGAYNEKLALSEIRWVVHYVSICGPRFNQVSSLTLVVGISATFVRGKKLFSRC